MVKASGLLTELYYLDTFKRHLNAWKRIPFSRQQGILNLIQGRITSKLKEIGRAREQESTEGYEDGAEEAELDAYLTQELEIIQQQTAAAMRTNRTQRTSAEDNSGPGSEVEETLEAGVEDERRSQQSDNDRQEVTPAMSGND